jgi:hypothetical protein
MNIVSDITPPFFTKRAAPAQRFQYAFITVLIEQDVGSRDLLIETLHRGDDRLLREQHSGIARLRHRPII